MKNIKLISILICTIVIISALAIASNAKFWDENPFTDVKSSHWYYDAVRICNENEVFSGTAADKYSPSVKMTRAMLVKALANLDGYTEDFKGTTPFTDVKSGHWFASAVEWAYTNGITSGKTDTTFAPNENITREQLAAMLYRYASYKGMTVENSKSITDFPDANKVASYAVANFEWAYGNGIINGSKSGDKLYLNPRNPATRAECATMFSKYLYLEPSYTINGNDLSLYTIVYSEGEIESVKEAAEFLSENIELSLGITLPVATDTTPATDYEILVGRTNREDDPAVKVDRSAFADDNYFLWTVRGNKLVITGIDTSADRDTGDRSTYNMDGTYNAVHLFCEDVLGIEFYTEDNVVATPDPVIAFEDGYTYTDKVDFKCMTLDIDGYKFSTGNYYSEWGCNLPHQIGNLMNGNWEKGIYANTWDNPCFTDPANKASLIENVGKLLELNKTLNLVGLIQNDSSGICKCTDCAKVYRDYGTRGAAMLLLINEVCEAYEEIYPNVKFATWNYTWAEKPPVGMTLHENILLYYNTLILCPAHDYGDPECEHNDVVIERLEAWSELTTPNMFMWEHSNATEAPLTPFPNLNNMRNNIELFASYGINGVFLNGANSHSDEWEFSDFNSMRGYLFSQLFRNAFMSEEEYDYRINSYLKAVYGDGYKSLRSYLDLIDKLGDTQCHTLHSSTKGYYNFDEVIRYIDTIDGYWKTAKAVATEEQLYLIEQAELSWLYLKQCALYDSQYTNGDTASKALYMENNEKLYTQMEKYGKYQLTWGHPADKSPETWW